MSVNDLLTEDEINALLYGVENEKGLDSKEINSDNDTKNPDFIKNAQFIHNFIPEIDIICERYIVCLRGFLGNYLHQNIDISINNVLIDKYSDYLNSLSIPSCMNLVSSKKGYINLLLNLDTNLSNLVIDHYFGGSGKYPVHTIKQEFTNLELHVLKTVVINAITQLEKSWELIHPIKLNLLETEFDTQDQSILDTDEVIGIIRFKVESGTIAGNFDLVIPHSTMRIIKKMSEN